MTQLGEKRPLLNVCHAHELVNVPGGIFTLADKDQMPKVGAMLTLA